MEKEGSDVNTKVSNPMLEPKIMDDVNTAIMDALRGGAKLLTSMYTMNYSSRKKMDKTLVTEADFAVHNYIIEVLSERTPGVCVDSEEDRASSLALKESSKHWILDPLDGTENFATLNPHFGIALGLVSNDVVIAGGVIQPFTDVLFSFGGAQGPLINGNVFPRSEIGVATIEGAGVAFIPTATSQRTEFAQRAHAKIYSSCRRLIDNWAPSLDWCALSTGRIDAIVSYGKTGAYEDFDARIGKALFQEVWGHDAHIEKHMIGIGNRPHVLEIATRNPELAQELRVRLLDET